MTSTPQDEWYALARQQCDRMMGSPMAKALGHRASLDDYYIRGKVGKLS
jgi:hypothetical protein